MSSYLSHKALLTEAVVEWDGIGGQKSMKSANTYANLSERPLQFEFLSFPLAVLPHECSILDLFIWSALHGMAQ